MNNKTKENRINVRLSDKYYQYIKGLAQDKETNLSQVIREMIIESYKKDFKDND